MRVHPHAGGEAAGKWSTRDRSVGRSMSNYVRGWNRQKCKVMTRSQGRRRPKKKGGWGGCWRRFGGPLGDPGFHAACRTRCMPHKMSLGYHGTRDNCLGICTLSLFYDSVPSDVGAAVGVVVWSMDRLAKARSANTMPHSTTNKGVSCLGLILRTLIQSTRLYGMLEYYWKGWEC